MTTDKTKDHLGNPLNDEQQFVCYNGGTEAPFSGKFLYNKDKGDYVCIACGAKLFNSDAKFDSGTGWPSFDRVENNDAVRLVEDTKYNMRRVEVRCKKCNVHLGHVFPDGPTETGQRFCINSAALDFKKGSE